MWKEWTSLCGILGTVVFILYAISTSISTAQVTTAPTSTSLSPATLTTKSMQCYGNPTLGGMVDYSDQECGPGSQDYDNYQDCASGTVMAGMNWYASLWDPSMYCNIRCKSITMSQTRCQWR